MLLHEKMIWIVKGEDSVKMINVTSYRRRIELHSNSTKSEHRYTEQIFTNLTSDTSRNSINDYVAMKN